MRSSTIKDIPSQESREKWFRSHLLDRELELKELYERRLKLKSISIATGETIRAMLPREEQHLTMREREQKVLAEARAAGHTPERA